jgi:protein TonB
MASNLSAGMAEFVSGRQAMFEDSIFESAGRIHTRSHEWMVAAFAFNTTILLAFVMIPLICPPALPHQVSSFLMQVFVPPKPQLPQQQPTQTARPSTEMQNGVVFAPPRIPPTIYYPAGPEPVIDEGIGSWASNSTDPAGVPFGKPGGPAVRLESKAPVRVSTTVEAGLLIQKTMPIYPPIARATRTSGTVTLAAIISKSGTIENLRVTGGPAILQQAALDAVRTWRYRPYLLDGQPVEVETTISVIFTLER